MNYDEDIDALGLLCPLPVLKARKKLASMDQGTVLALLADDPAAAIDVPHFCAESGNEFLGQFAADGLSNGKPAQRYLIRKK